MTENNPSLLTKAERFRLRLCFWVLFLLTPVAPFLVGAGSSALDGSLPGWLSQTLPVGVRCFLTAGGCLFGTAYCLVKLWVNPVELLDVVIQTMGFAVMLFFAYLMIAVAGFIIVSAFVSAAGG